MLAPDTILQGRYLIVQLLAEGGMGAVYQAIDQRLDATVALKETHFSVESLRKQFELEAHLLARLHHPALPKVSDHFTEGDGQFLVMQFIPGEDLAGMLKRNGAAFPVTRVLDWADQLLDALDYLHTQQPPIIHRDIKPQNLKLTSRGQIILLDFGLAKGKMETTPDETDLRSIRGYTPNYAPLEQVRGKGTDPRSDLYALAATVYTLLTLTVPPDAVARATAAVNGEPEPLPPANGLNPQVPAEINAVLMKALNLKRDQRPATAAEMRQALRAAHPSDASTLIEPELVSTTAQIDSSLRETEVVAAISTAPAPATEEKQTKGELQAKTQTWANRFLSRKVIIRAIVPLLLVAISAFAYVRWRAWQAGQERVLKYYLTVQRVRDGKDYKEPFVSTGEGTLESGSKLRLNIYSPQPGYLYLLDQGPSANDGTVHFVTLFPAPFYNNGSAQLAANQNIPIPFNNWFLLTGDGSEKLWIVWASQPLPELEALKGLVNPKDRGNIRDPFQLQAVQDLLKKYGQPAPEVEKDRANKLTIIKGRNDILVYSAELEHL